MKNTVTKTALKKNEYRRTAVKLEGNIRQLTLSELSKIGGGDRPRGGNY